MDFKKELISKIEEGVTALKDKIQPGAVDSNIATPFAAFDTPKEEPIRTFDGIVGYTTTIDIAILDTTLAKLEPLKAQLIKTLDNQIITDKRVYFQSSNSAYYDEQKLHGYTLTFKIK